MAHPLKPLHGVNSKILRTEEHFESLNEDILAYLKVCGQKVTPYVDSQKNLIRLRFSLERKAPLRISAIVGDCLHNTRCALDHTWKRLDGPGNFPMFSTPSEWKGHRSKKLMGVAAGAHAIIDSLQPYNASDPSAHPLAVLNALANIDKHDSIHLAAAQSGNTRIIVTNQATGEIHTLSLPTPLYEEADVMFTDMPPGAVKPGMDVQIKGQLIVAFKEPGPWQRQPVHEVLRRCLDFVKDSVIVPLAPFIK